MGLECKGLERRLAELGDGFTITHPLWSRGKSEVGNGHGIFPPNWALFKIRLRSVLDVLGLNSRKQTKSTYKEVQLQLRGTASVHVTAFVLSLEYKLMSMF